MTWGVVGEVISWGWECAARRADVPSCCWLTATVLRLQRWNTLGLMVLLQLMIRLRWLLLLLLHRPCLHELLLLDLALLLFFLLHLYLLLVLLLLHPKFQRLKT